MDIVLSLGNWGYLIAVLLAFFLAFGALIALEGEGSGHSGAGPAIAGLMFACVFSVVLAIGWHLLLQAAVSGPK